MHRITSTEVEHAVGLLCKKLVIEINLQVWSPGDGWTRYQMINGPFSSRVWRGAELHAACWLALDAIEADRRRGRD